MNFNEITGAMTSNIVVGNVFEQVNSLFNQGKGTIIIGVGVLIILICGFVFWQTKGSWGKTLSTMVLGALVGWFVVGGYSTMQKSVGDTLEEPSAQGATANYSTTFDSSFLS